MAATTSRSYTETKRSLARTITRARSDCVPIEAARLLLSYDRPHHALVGLAPDAERAVYYDEESRTAFACPFDDTGPDGVNGVEFADLPRAVTVDDWVLKMDPYWSWLHPRYA